MTPRHIHISDFSYQLPEERIAKFPVTQRDHSKLLLYRHGEVGEDIFYNLPHYLPEGGLMVFNNTKVIQARMLFHKETGALIEVFLLEPAEPADYEQMFQTLGCCRWLCLVGNLRKWKRGTLTMGFDVDGKHVTLTATRIKEEHTSQLVEFRWDDTSLSFGELLDAVGILPIPPYLNRETQESDKQTYQTVYSKIKGSVAAPTAGLHFTDEVLSAIDAKGVEREELTLHVGAGTFRPVKSEEIGNHEMHTEYFSVLKSTIDKLIAHEGSAIAVGTTSVRTLESLYYMGMKLKNNPNLSEDELHVSQWEPYDMGEQGKEEISSVEALVEIKSWLERNELDALRSSTQIIIVPGYKYHIVDMLITNFHQPKSTLLLLVGAFVGDNWRKIYDYALSHDFRFLSYGDSSLLIP